MVAILLKEANNRSAHIFKTRSTYLNTLVIVRGVLKKGQQFFAARRDWFVELVAHCAEFFRVDGKCLVVCGRLEACSAVARLQQVLHVAHPGVALPLEVVSAFPEGGRFLQDLVSFVQSLNQLVPFSFELAAHGFQQRQESRSVDCLVNPLFIELFRGCARFEILFAQALRFSCIAAYSGINHHWIFRLGKKTKTLKCVSRADFARNMVELAAMVIDSVENVVWKKESLQKASQLKEMTTTVPCLWKPFTNLWWTTRRLELV